MSFDLDNTKIYILAFPARTNLKINIKIRTNILSTPKMVRKVMTNIDSSKSSWYYSNCTSANFEPKVV